MSDLDVRLLAAHAAGDKRALVDLYTAAADAASDIDGACFFLTHAYIFALDSGAPQAASLRERLINHGREE